MIISVMEKVKYNILSQQHTETWSTEEAGRSLGNDQADLEGTFYTHVKQESGSSASSDSGYEGEWLGGANMRKLSAVFSPHTCQTLSFWSNSMIPAISATWLGIGHHVPLSCAIHLLFLRLHPAFPFLCLVTQHSSSLYWLPSPRCPLSFILVTRSP